MKRQATITISVGCAIDLTRFHSRERLGEIFQIDANIIAASKVDFLKSLGKKALIEVFELGKTVRVFHALLTEAHFLSETDEGYHYFLVLKPWLYALAYNRTYRIFEEKTGLDIIKQVLADQSRHVDYGKIRGRYRPRKYTTQYRESDFDFISRIMEREGIYYYFEHRRDDHVLVLCDAPSSHRTAPGYETVKLRSDKVGQSGGLAGALWRWHEHVRDNGERRFLLQSFDYETTSVKTGQSDGGSRNPADTQEVHEYTGDFVEEALAKHWSKVGIESARARQRVYSGEGDTIGLFCGSRFKLDSTDAFDRGREFVVTALDYAVDAEPFRSDTEAVPRRVLIEAITSDTQWRSPITTAAPRAGPETAIVMVGGADDTKSDDTGRVRVRFLWGRPGEAPDKARSCWLRISYPSAGASFGHVTLPRQDEEVIVDFLDSNPDRPIITGRVYNSQNTHPYRLPQHRTRSLYRSQTIGKKGSYPGAERQPPAGKGYNELRFDDKGGSEEVYLRAQRNRLTEVLLDDDVQIRRDRKTRVGRDRETEIRRNETLKVETGDYNLSVRQGSAEITALRRIKLGVGRNSLTIDPASITLRVGLNTIVVSAAGIVLDGLTVTSIAKTTQTISGALTTVEAKGLLSLIGKPPLIA